MDETVKLSAIFLLVACTVASTFASAQPLQDPTRPPASLIPRPEGGIAAAGSATAAEKRAPRLQSVLIARQPGGRHIAVIDGETLRLGDLYKGARVARIAQNEVELVRGRARQVLKLYMDGVPASKRTETN